jgi:MinD-like ATPase involved in chromosome partitioning or flagellar assembly
VSRQSILLLSGCLPWEERVLAWADQFDVYSCTSPEEARALLTSSRPWAVMLIDATDHGADRDLLDLAARTGARPVIVDGPSATVDWLELGAHAVLPPEFGRRDVFAVLSAEAPTPPAASLPPSLVCVTGPGGTGASTVAIGISQGLAARPSHVLLCDFRRHAEQHVLHHLDAEGPGVDDLVQAHRTASPGPAALSELPPFVPRGYRLLAGIRRAVGWSSLRPRALAAALAGLRAAYDVVVCDMDPDLEGEAEGGSVDVEDRNTLARTAAANATAAVVVGGPGAKGTHALLRVLGELWSHGISPARTIAVVNRADRMSLDRLGAALDQLGGGDTATLHLPELEIEPLLLNGARLPAAFVDPLTEAVLPLLRGEVPPAEQAPQRITPGSLGLRRSGPDPR